MNVTLHYTKGKGYYEDYKADAKMYKYNLTPFVDGDGNTVKRTDLVRRKWLKNDFYGAIYNANYKGGFYNLNLGAGINNYDGNHFGNVIWAKNYNNLINDERYYDSDASKLDFNVFLKRSEERRVGKEC